MSLKKLLDIGKRNGCENEIREWMLSSVRVFGVNKTISNFLVHQGADIEKLIHKSMAREAAHELGTSIIESPSIRMDEHEESFGKVTTYRALLIKPDREDLDKGLDEPTPEEKVADNAGIG
jgi:hypothetical protein